MERSKLTKNDIDKVIPPKEKNEAIKQSERYEQEYNLSKMEVDELLKRLEELIQEYKSIED